MKSNLASFQSAALNRIEMREVKGGLRDRTITVYCGAGANKGKTKDYPIGPDDSESAAVAHFCGSEENGCYNCCPE